MEKLKTLIYFSLLTILPIEIAIILGKYLGFLFVIVILISFIFLQFFYLKKINRNRFIIGVKDNFTFSIIFLFLFFILSALNSFFFDGSFKLLKFVNTQILVEIYFTILFLLLLIWCIIYLLFKK